MEELPLNSLKFIKNKEKLPVLYNVSRNQSRFIRVQTIFPILQFCSPVSKSKTVISSQLKGAKRMCFRFVHLLIEISFQDSRLNPSALILSYNSGDLNHILFPINVRTAERITLLST